MLDVKRLWRLIGNTAGSRDRRMPPDFKGAPLLASCQDVDVLLIRAALLIPRRVAILAPQARCVRTVVTRSLDEVIMCTHFPLHHGKHHALIFLAINVDSAGDVRWVQSDHLDIDVLNGLRARGYVEAHSSGDADQPTFRLTAAGRHVVEAR